MTGSGTTLATVALSTPEGCPTDPAIGAMLVLAIVTLGLVAAHFSWHLYRKYIPERKAKGRT